MLKSCVLILITFFIVGCSKPKTNIIIILADDAGYADFGFTGSSDILTPNIDKLASDGLVFKNAYVSASVCSPSRAGLLTGMYQQRFGHECNLDSDVNNSFDPNQITIAEALKSKSYHTGIIGKWHLGDKKQNHPLNNGFDYFWGFISGARNYFFNKNETLKTSHKSVMENNTYTEFKGYLTDVLGNKAVNFIDIYSKSDNPFFLYLSFNAPHTPMEAKKDVLEKFKNNPRKTYASMMWSMDQAIGNVIEKLKNDGVYDNTIIYFLSDNGAAMSNGASSFPYKGWKGNQYEGGIKTPMIMTWKNRIKPNTTYNGFISSLDIFKTSVTIAKIEDSLTNKSDGKNIMNLLTNPLIINEDLYWRKDKMASVRSGNYKLIRLNETNTVLYNLKNNFREDIDIKNTKKYIHDSLLKKLLLWEGKLTKPNWTENKDWDLVTQMIYEDLMSNSEIRAKSPNDLKNNQL